LNLNSKDYAFHRIEKGYCDWIRDNDTHFVFPNPILGKNDARLSRVLFESKNYLKTRELNFVTVLKKKRKYTQINGNFDYVKKQISISWHG
jgi:hypothetical protein